MKCIISFLILTLTHQIYADFFFIHNSNIYSITSKYAPDKSSVEKAHFLKIDLKQNHKNGTATYKSLGVSFLGAIDHLKTPTVPETPAGEGCRENPMSWLKSSKIIGKLKNKNSAIYIQIPAEVNSFSQTAIKCPNDDRFSDNPLKLSIADKEYAVLICSGELNNNLLLMKNNSIIADLVITDNCP